MATGQPRDPATQAALACACLAVIPFATFTAWFALPHVSHVAYTYYEDYRIPLFAAGFLFALASFVFFMKAIGRMSKYRDELSWPFYAALIFAVPVLVAVAALPLMVIIAVLSLFSGRGLHG